MAEVTMNVELLAHTRLSTKFLSGSRDDSGNVVKWERWMGTDGQSVSLTAIRTCYSPNKPSNIIDAEAGKYFVNNASDGNEGNEAQRLFRHIVASGHTSTLEHLSFTFAIEGVSRSLLSQLTRHRIGFSFSVQSQRYVKFGSGDKSGGFDYVVPQKIRDNEYTYHRFCYQMDDIQETYDKMRSEGIPSEDARAVLPNAAATNLVMTANLRALLDFYSKRRKGRGAQEEITELAEMLRREVVDVEPWLDQFFEEA